MWWNTHIIYTFLNLVYTIHNIVFCHLKDSCANTHKSWALKHEAAAGVVCVTNSKGDTESFCKYTEIAVFLTYGNI